MPNWITIALADVYNSKAAPIVDQINQQLLGAGQVSRVPGIIADVTLEIRRRVARANVVDQDVTKIPGGLKPLAVDLVYCRLKIAAELALSDDEKMLLRQREDQLDRIADGRDVVDPPDIPVAANAVQMLPSPGFGPGCRRHFTNRTQEG